MRNTDYVLSALEYDIACAELGIEEMPYPVPITRHGVTMEERSELADSARDSLAKKGFLERGRLIIEIEDALTTVANAAATVDVLGYDGTAVRAVAGRARNASAVVLADRGQIVLRNIGTTPMTDALLALFPDCSAGPGQSVSVPWQAFAEISGHADADSEELGPFYDPVQQDDTQILKKYGMSSMDAIRLSAIAEERVRGGQFGVNTREPRGRKMHRDSVVFSFYDTQSGRYLMVNDGSWVSITPADSRRIAGRINDVLPEMN